MKKTEDSDVFSKVEYKHEYSASSFDYARINKFTNTRCDAISEKHQSTCCPAAKHPKHSKLKIDNIRDKPVIFSVATNWNGTLALLRIEASLEKLLF